MYFYMKLYCAFFLAIFLLGQDVVMSQMNSYIELDSHSLVINKVRSVHIYTQYNLYPCLPCQFCEIQDGQSSEGRTWPVKIWFLATCGALPWHRNTN